MGLRALTLFLITLPLFSSESQALFLVQKGLIKEGIEQYVSYKEKAGAHDFETLKQIGEIILDQGAFSSDPEVRLLSIYGTGIAQKSDTLTIFEAGVESRDPVTQLAAIHYLGELIDDRSSELLARCCSSDYLGVRMEAAYHLARRKNPHATDQIEALMYKLPPMFRVHFAEFFALIGTPKAISLLRQLMNDQELMVRSSAVMSAAQYGRDDLLSYIRALATHKNPAEQEICALALGMLGDTHQRERLEQLSKSPYENVRLAALKALYQLGETHVQSQIIEMANKGDLFAILLLGSIEGSEPTLEKLLSSKDRAIQFNAALALLQRKSPACTLHIAEFLTSYPHELGCQPIFSTGRAQIAWSFATSSEKYAKLAQTDVLALTLDLKYRVLQATLDLPQPAFLDIARSVFSARVTPLIPPLVHLLENNKSPEAIELLKVFANAPGAPLMRGFCNLGLLRLGVEGPYEELVIKEITRLKDSELIRFRASAPKGAKQTFTPFSLTPEETSQLLVESYQTLASRQEDKSIDILLKAIGEGHPKNRYALAGLLLKTLQ
ncbi:MAG: HEAT repeat domain-containing protein [Chlamydiales bacterium]|nr:HEAT repeat domain-containing protein [Chlamydiales bacterium]